MKVFIFGLGYTGGRLANLLLQHGHAVGGTVRSEASAEQWRSQGVVTFVWDSSKSAFETPLAALDGCTHIISTAQVAPDGKDPVLSDAALVDALKKQDTIEFVGYLSTTGVYGNQDGAEVNEETVLKPSSRRGKAREQAESDWSSLGLPLYIFRLPGIYGPHRGPLEKLRTGTARRINKPNHVFSRIHVDDICGVLITAMKGDFVTPLNSSEYPYPRIYNVVDCLPESASIVTEYAAKLLCIEPPKEEEWATAVMSDMARSFYDESKRVSNKKLLKDLNYKLAYPTYKEGLVAQLEEETGMTLKEYQQSQTWKVAVRPIYSLYKLCSQYVAVFFLTFMTILSSLIGYKKVMKTSVLLIDNGSIKAASTLNLRSIASKLSVALNISVHPVSIKFSNRVKASDLEGIEAEILEPAVLKRIQNEEINNFIILPLFFGPSESLNNAIKNLKENVKVKTSGATFQLARPLVDIDFDSKDTRLAEILASRILDVINMNNLVCPSVVVTDHGTPTRKVHDVREHVANQLKVILLTCEEPKVRSISTASMESREGEEYAFNKPLLQDALKIDGDVIISLLFLSPGKHAGPGGDIVQIVDQAVVDNPNLHPYLTELVGTHSLIIDILVDRYKGLKINNK